MKKFQEIYVIDYTLANLYKNFYQLNTQYCLMSIPKKYYEKQKEKYEIQINKYLLKEQMAWQEILRKGLHIEHGMCILEKNLNLNIAILLFGEELDSFYRIYYNLYYRTFLQKINKFSINPISSAKERYDFYDQLFFYKFIQKIIKVCDKNSYFNSQVDLAMQLYRNIFYKISFCDTNESMIREENFEKRIIKKAHLSWYEYKRYKNMVAKEDLEDFLKDLNTLSIEDLEIYLTDFSTLIYLNTSLSLLMDAAVIEEVIDRRFPDEEKKNLLNQTIKKFFPETMRFRLVK